MNEEVQDDQERWTDKEWKKRMKRTQVYSGINNDQKRHVNLHMTFV